MWLQNRINGISPSFLLNKNKKENCVELLNKCICYYRGITDCQRYALKIAVSSLPFQITQVLLYWCLHNNCHLSFTQNGKKRPAPAPPRNAMRNDACNGQTVHPVASPRKVRNGGDSKSVQYVRELRRRLVQDVRIWVALVCAARVETL